MSRLKERYKTEIRKDLQKQFNYANVHQIPKLIKISINMGVGEGVSNNKIVQVVANELTLISGQKTIITKAKKSIAGFKLREDVSIGTKVTLRNAKMYDFIDRLSNIALPRIRDFRGFNIKSFDGNGNFTFGIKEHIIFPEVDYDKVDKIRGMDITIVTTAKNSEEARALLVALNLPFKK